MNKKNLWSLLAIMMVSVLSFGFVACGDDDDENEDVNTTSNYVLDFDLTDKGNLTEAEVDALENFLEENVEDVTFEGYRLKDVEKEVKTLVKSFEGVLGESFPGKSFTVVVEILDIKTDQLVKNVVVKCKNGKVSF